MILVVVIISVLLACTDGIAVKAGVFSVGSLLVIPVE